MELRPSEFKHGEVNSLLLPNNRVVRMGYLDCWVWSAHVAVFFGGTYRDLFDAVTKSLNTSDEWEGASVAECWNYEAASLEDEGDSCKPEYDTFHYAILFPSRKATAARKMADVLHETRHLTDQLLRLRGVPSISETEEAFAYTHDALFTQVLKLFKQAPCRTIIVQE